MASLPKSRGDHKSGTALMRIVNAINTLLDVQEFPGCEADLLRSRQQFQFLLNKYNDERFDSQPADEDMGPVPPVVRNEFFQAMHDRKNARGLAAAYTGLDGAEAEGVDRG